MGDKRDDINADALGWKAEYAKSGENPQLVTVSHDTAGRSKCRSTQQLIGEGELRIGKTIKSPYSDKPGATIEQWFSLDGFLDYIRKGRVGKARPENSGELVGFDDLKSLDKKKLTSLLDSVNESVGALESAEATRLENTAGDNNKWWSICVAENLTMVQWGQIGDAQNEPGFTRKEHADEDAAVAFAEKTIKSKQKGGYVIVSGPLGEEGASGEGGSTTGKRKGTPEKKTASKKPKAATSTARTKKKKK